MLNRNVDLYNENQNNIILNQQQNQNINTNNNFGNNFNNKLHKGE